MKENIKKNRPKPTPPMDTITTKVVRLKMAKGCRHTSAREKLWRAFRGKDSLNTLGHLLCTVLRNSRAISTLVCTAKSNTTHQQGESVTEITHSLLSSSEEEYSLVTYRQKQRLCLLKLRLCLTDGVLVIHAEAPLFL